MLVNQIVTLEFVQSFAMRSRMILLYKCCTDKKKNPI